MIITNMMLKRFLTGLIAVCVLSCYAQDEKDPQLRLTLQTLNSRIREFEDSGKKQSQLVEISRRIISEMDYPPWAFSESWKLEVPKVETEEIKDYLKGVWNVRSVEIQSFDFVVFLCLSLDDHVNVIIYKDDVFSKSIWVRGHGIEVFWGDGIKLAKRPLRS